MVEIGLIAALTLKGFYIGDYRKLREIAQEAERIGVHSLWHCDHFVTLDPASYGSRTGFGSQDQAVDTAILEPWTTLAALARAHPPPVQRPHPPIWTGGEGDKLFGVSARQADGYNCR